MEESILTSTKKILNINVDYEQFDVDILISINSIFSTLHQLGVGPEAGFSVSDSTALWEDFIPPGPQLNLVKTYVFLKVKLLFDPPTTSFALDAMKEQIKEHEWRLNINRENDIIGEVA